MNRVAFLSSILWASVGLGGVITEPSPPREERYGTIQFPEPFCLLQGFQLPHATTLAYMDLLGTATSMDLAIDRIIDGRVSGYYDVVVADIPGVDLGNGFTRFDFRGMGIRQEKSTNPETGESNKVASKVILHGGSAPALSQNAPEKGFVSSYYYVPEGTHADNPGLPATPVGSAYVGIYSETLDPPYGDGNGDGRVDISDFGLLKDGFSQTVTPFHGGDVTGDYIVDINDFAVLKQNFGWRQPAAVPEPSAFGLLALGALLMLARPLRRPAARS